MLHCTKVSEFYIIKINRITCLLNFIYSRDEDSMSSVTQHRTRTLSVTSAGSAVSCSTIPPVSTTHVPVVGPRAVDRVVSLGTVRISGHVDIWISYVNVIK